MKVHQQKSRNNLPKFKNKKTVFKKSKKKLNKSIEKNLKNYHSSSDEETENINLKKKKFKPNLDEENYSDDENIISNEFVSSNLYNNIGWADVIKKILSKNPNLNSSQKCLILSKAKKDCELIEQEPLKKTEKQRLEWENLNRLKPSANDNERERKLCSIATRGVVQLFNIIAKQKIERKKKVI